MLLDTNVVLWSVNDDAKLGAGARAAMSSAPQLLVSAVTHAEIAIKVMRGRLSVPADFAEQLQQAGIDPLPLDSRHVRALHELTSLVGHDPFDRLLVAQARAEGVAFVTSDQVLLALDRPWIIDATT